jgi:proteic killer suppression protein
MIKRFHFKALKLAFDGDVSKLTPNVASRIVQVLDTLDAATSLSDLEGLTGFHQLSGDRQGTYAVTITRNWRITFILQTEEIENLDTGEKEMEFQLVKVDYEDYHGD